MDDEVSILDEEDYSTWRIKMRLYLKMIHQDFSNDLWLSFYFHKLIDHWEF
jgi:hypothetical protein